MTAFDLKIVTPDGLVYDGQAEEVIVRTAAGDMGILANHINCAVALGMGRATIVIDGQKKYAACIGGMLSVVGGKVNLVPTTFEWADQIDVSRAEASYQRATEALQDKTRPETDLRIMEARLKRALVRKSVAEYR